MNSRCIQPARETRRRATALSAASATRIGSLRPDLNRHLGWHAFTQILGLINDVRRSPQDRVFWRTAGQIEQAIEIAITGGRAQITTGYECREKHDASDDNRITD